jgi:KDO2-lipid IV(A) lauroyltransferase
MSDTSFSLSPAFKPKYWPTWLGLCFLRLICLLPYPVLMQIGKGIGLLAYRLMKKRKRIAQINIDACFNELPQAERDALTKEAMVNTGIGIMEGFYSWWTSFDEINARGTLHGADIVREAQARGQGVIILSPHYTSIEVSGRILFGNLPADTTYRAQNNAAIDWCLTRARQQDGCHLIEKTEMRKMIKRLKQGRAMWYACDQDFGRKNSVFAPFFGHQAATIATIGRLVKITGAKVVFIDYFRDDSQGFAKSHYHVNISDPFTDQFNASDLDNAIVMNQAVEASVRQHKSQYFWVHKRFKKRPKHETKNFY